MPQSEVVAITQGADRPGCTLTTDYMPYMGWEGNGGLNGPVILQEDAQMRLLDGWNQTTQAKKAAFQERDLSKALALDERAISLETRIERTLPNARFSGTNTYSWFSIYEIQHELGRIREARDALGRSRDEDVRLREKVRAPLDRGPHCQQIQAALKAERMR